ncbi:MAG: hypothetical protein M3Q36_00910 [bacterium]|nr:hypothetical protein [bacterium]
MKKQPKKSKRLQISHQRHTAKVLHRNHTSYPLLGLLLMVVGVFLAFMTINVRAADITVTAVNVGTPPPYAAVITSPINNAVITTQDIDVKGTCPPQFFVKLYRNNLFSGSVFCGPSGTFSIATSLFLGKNDLEVRVFNVADSEGPRSPGISVYYDPPETVRPPITRPGDSVFYISTDYFYKAAYSGQTTTWDFTIYGGDAPYKATVDWGDGTTSTHTTSDKKLELSHKYQTLESEREYFIVVIRLQDSQGRLTSLQLVAIMNEPDVVGGASARLENPTPSGANWGLNLGYIWSAYLIALLMGVSFWLGERRGEDMRNNWRQPKLKAR